MSRWRYWVGVLLVVAAACGGSDPDAAAVELIEGTLAEDIGLGALIASCEGAENAEQGDTFTCRATTEDGRLIEFDGLLDEEDIVRVNTTNIIIADGLPDLEAAAVSALEESVGQTLGIENFDCGDETVILGADLELTCALTDPVGGAIYDAVVTFTDLDALEFDVVVAQTPRP